MSALNDASLLVGGLLVAGALTAFVRTAVTQPLSQRPDVGMQGLKRLDALRGRRFALLEGPMRMLGRHMARFELRALRAWLVPRLRQSGYFLGLSADDMLALAVLGALACAIAGIVVAYYAGVPFTEACIAGAAIGAALPFSELQSEIRRRMKNIVRELPGAIDVVALCMGAGLDFPGALRTVLRIRRASIRRADAIQDELERMVQELDLGTTRARVLTSFADRVSHASVQEFVSAVVQSEEKGTPLAAVLEIQATVLRTQRSVRAEELATKAGLRMMLPLMMLFGAVGIVLFGPFVVTMTQSGF